MKEARVFHLYGKRELEEIQAGVQRSLGDWMNAWAPEQMECTVLAHDMGKGDWCNADIIPLRLYRTAGDEHVLMVRKSEELKAIANLIAGPASRAEPARLPLSPLVSELVDKALKDLAARLLAVSCAELDEEACSSEHVADMQVAGSGGVACEVRLGTIALSVFLPHVVAGRYFTPVKPAMARADFVPLIQALAERRLEAKLVLGHSELTLAELASLSEGDVILLERRTNENFELRTLNGEKIVPVQIGKKGSQLVATVSGN